MSPAPPRLLALAEDLHRQPPPGDRAHLLGFAEGGRLVSCWPIPDGAPHPAEVLVGWTAPPAWVAVGLHTPATFTATAPVGPLTAGPSSGSARLTVVVAREGSVVSVLGSETEPLVLTEAPTGWTADVLARCLGRAAPAADTSVAAWVDAVWLDRLATSVLAEPAEGARWRWLALHHPLVGTGLVPTPAALARRTLRFAQQRPWAELRRVVAREATVPAGLRPPAGGQVDAASWFDDGAFSRWCCRLYAPPGPVLTDLLAVLGPASAEQVLSGLADTAIEVVRAAPAEP